MSDSFVLLSPQKPTEGAPCNGCGYCCQNVACELSVEFLKSSIAPCIALEWDGRLYRCGLVVHPSKYLKVPISGDAFLGSEIAITLGIGSGCDSIMGRVEEIAKL